VQGERAPDSIYLLFLDRVCLLTLEQNTILNKISRSSHITILIKRQKEAENSAYLYQFNLRRPLVISIPQRPAVLRLYSSVYNLAISNPSQKMVLVKASSG
jgi:hypothetical protein